MGSWKFNLIRSLIFLVTIISAVTNSKLNVPRVLLPIFSDFSTKFTLEATDGGCYQWTTTRVDIIQLTPVDENSELECSSKVIVSTVTKEEARNLAVVLAEDVNTKQTLRCDVIVDVIHSLSVVTTTRELFMEEAPEAFEIRAYDDQGNEFSTLEGVELDWKIISLSPSKQAVVLRYMTFNDSPYEAPPAIAALEEQNKKGYMVLLEGVKTGSSKISIRLPHPEYKHVSPVEVQLAVVANLILSPAEVYLMAGDVITYKLYHMNNGRMDEILLPDAQYYLECEDKNIARADKKSAEVTALKEGKTRILLRDRNVGQDDPAVKLPTATINIVQPAYLTISVMPYKNWAILIGEPHDLIIEAFSSSDHKLHIGAGVEIHTIVAELFHVEEKSVNGSWLSGWGIKEGQAPVTATLVGITNPSIGKFKLDNPVVAKGDLLIYPQITITPSDIILPWDPQTKPKYEIDLVASGGDGRFLWTSSDHSKGSVTQSGRVKTYSHGYFEVSAAMLRNHHNRQSAKLLILPPTRLEIVEFVMEAEVGSTIYLHIALYAKKPGTEDSDSETYLPFTQCQQLHFHIKQSDNKFRHNRTDVIPPVGVSCANIAMVALSVGTSKVTISYTYDGIVLEDSVTLSAYLPLKLLQPEQDVVLAVGSSVNLVFTGGPRPVVGRPSDHLRVVVSSNESIAQAFDVTDQHALPDSDYTVVNVLCRELGESCVKLTVSNVPSVPNCKSTSNSVIVSVICGKPRCITLQPVIKVADPNLCPMDLTADKVIVQSNFDIELDVQLQDEIGRRFLNFSSLQLNWQLGPKEVAEFTTNKPVESIIPKPIEIGSVQVARNNYQIVRALQGNGSFEVNVTVTGYDRAVLKKNRITPEWPVFLSEDEKNKELPPIKDRITLVLVDDIIVSPQSINIYNHPKNKQRISIKQGSGYYELNLNADDVISVTYLESTREIEITPIKSGEVILQVTDLCLMSKPALVMVNVVSVGIIRVEMSDKVEINRCISCIVRLYDENDNIMLLPELSMVDLVGRSSEPDLVNIQQLPEEEHGPFPIGEIHYIITGVELGDTKITFTLHNGEEEVSSAPADLQVFPPLKLYPKNGTILIGATLQLSTKGGPKPESTIEYIITSDKAVDISSKGVATGKTVGRTSVMARSIGLHPTTGQRVIYSEDTADIQVIQLTGIKIAAPLTRFKVGATVPLWVYGIPDQISPLVLGTIDDQYTNFQWKVEDTEIADVKGVFHPTGIEYDSPDQVAVRLTGLQPGRTKVVLEATFRGVVVGLPKKESQKLTSSIDIEVFEPLVLTNPPKLCGQSILMAPHSVLQLETNLDSYSQITYCIPGEDISKSSSQDTSLTVINEVVSVSRTGLLESQGVLGHAMLTITAKDEANLKQTLSFVIEVKPIHYMMLNVRSRWQIHSESPLHIIPLGTEFELKALYYDNIGNIFNSGPSELKIRTSRCDLVKVKHGSSNSSLMIATKKPGHTVIKAWAEGVQRTADYVKIHIEDSIKPPVDHLVTGDILCLHSPVVNKYSQKGHWSTRDKGLMVVVPKSDIAYVVSNREGVVILTHSMHPSAPLHIQILPATKIRLMPQDPQYVTNSKVSIQFGVPLVLLSEKSPEDKTTNLIQGWKCTNEVTRVIEPEAFRCLITFTNVTNTVDANQVFTVENSFWQRTGQYACIFKPTDFRSPEVSTLETTIRLLVVTSDDEIFSEHLTKFIPSVYVPLEVIIDESVNLGELEVIGLNYILKEVTVKPNDPNILYVSDKRFENEKMIKYKIKLLDYHWKLAEIEDAMTLTLSSPLSNETLTILVKVSGDGTYRCAVGQSPLYRFIVAYRHILAILLTMLLVFAITLYVYTHYMNPVVNVNVMSNRSLLSGSRICPTVIPCPAAMPCPTAIPCPGAGMSPQHSGSYSPCSSLPSSSHICSTSSPTHMYASRLNCTCCSGKKEPIYGDVSSFYNTSPDLRRNRRFI